MRWKGRWGRWRSIDMLQVARLSPPRDIYEGHLREWARWLLEINSAEFEADSATTSMMATSLR